MKTLKRILAECVLVALLGCVFGLAANATSRKGLSLTTNYFPTHEARQPLKAPTSRPQTADGSPSTTEKGPAEERHAESPATPAAPNAAQQDLSGVEKDLLESGLQPLHHEQAAAEYLDPLYAAQLTVFVDARNDEHYNEGHIPGALHFDRYRPGLHLPAVMEAAKIAQKIIVYCGGGDCEDSKFAAFQLLNNGIDPGRVYVYIGGVKEWTLNNLPLEQGERNSGQLIQGAAK
jgi:rhodanese-related sulfurtransferase